MHTRLYLWQILRLLHIKRSHSVCGWGFQATRAIIYPQILFSIYFQFGESVVRLLDLDGKCLQSKKNHQKNSRNWMRKRSNAFLFCCSVSFPIIHHNHSRPQYPSISRHPLLHTASFPFRFLFLYRSQSVNIHLFYLMLFGIIREWRT